ncbi:MAG TPA: hypothetical protein VIU34_29345, partial [Steroidobacter sp.]
SGKGTRWIASALVQKALDRGGEDNVTVQLLRYAPHVQVNVMTARLLAFGFALCAAVLCFMVVELREISGQLQELERLVKSPPAHGTASAPAKQASRGKKKSPSVPPAKPLSGPPQ